MALLDKVEVIVDLADVQFGRQLVKMKGNVGQVKGMFVQRAFALS